MSTSNIERVCFDLNVLIDVAARWQSYPDSAQVFETIVFDPQYEGRWPACAFTTYYYVLAKLITAPRAREFIAHISDSIDMIPFDGDAASLALRLNMNDLEDACIAASAFLGECDLIITRNEKDFSRSPVKAITPTALLSQVA